MRKSSDSSGPNWRSVARSSSSSPVARRRAIGRGGSVRVEMTTWTFAGASSTKRITESWQSSLSSRWKSSRTSTQPSPSGSSARATAAAGSPPGPAGRAGMQPPVARDPLERRGDVGPEHGLVVVLDIDGQPGERSRIEVRPVGQQGRLAEPGRRDEEREGRPLGDEQARQAGATHGFRPQPRGVQLRRLQRRSWSGPCATSAGSLCLVTRPFAPSHGRGPIGARPCAREASNRSASPPRHSGVAPGRLDVVRDHPRATVVRMAGPDRM